MDEIILLSLLLGTALVLWPLISSAILFARTKRLQARGDALEGEVRRVREVRAARDVREVQEVPKAQPAQAAPAAPAAPAVPAAAAAPAAPAAPTPPAPHAPPAPLAPEAPRAAAPHAPLAPEAPRAAARRAPEAPRLDESLETMIGTRWFLYIGIVAIVLGVAYFEKLAIDRGWVTPMARVIQGAVVGLALMFAGTRFVKRGYAGYGQIITGGGGAILYLSTYAAFNFYALITRPTAFVLMVAITVLIASLADRQRSQGLALIAVGGGFATPFLLPGTTDAQIALFTYDAILIAGTAALSHRRDWPFLNLVSYVFTLLTVAAWADRFYAADKYLRTEIYLTSYCAMFLYILREGGRKTSDAAKVVTLLLWTAPIAYYFASLAVLAPHDVALMVWLVGLMLAGGIAATRFGPAAGFVTWMAVAAPLVIWCATPIAGSMRQEGLITLAAVYAIALLAELEGTVFRDEPRDVQGIDIAWIHLNPLAMYAGAYALISPLSLVNAGYLAAAFAAWHGLLASALWRKRLGLALHVLVVGLTLAAVAIALIFNGTAITAGWAVEGALVIALAIRQRLAWLRAAGLLLFAIAVGQTVALSLSPVEASHVIIFNERVACAALVIGLCYLLAWYDWRDPETPGRSMGIGAALLTAQFLTLVALTAEIHAYWAARNGHLEQQLTFSVAWGLYATVLVVVGLARNYAPLRYFAIGVLAITIAKVFFVDMAELDRIYRVGSVIALGVVLLVTSYLYTRARKVAEG
jgi:uncharacterized membrane protein